MNKKNILNIVLGVLYYVLGAIGFFYLFIFTLLFGAIIDFSHGLFAFCYVILPVVVLALPIAIKLITKKEFYKSILFSSIGVIIYFIIVFCIEMCIIRYMKDFTVDKWNNYVDFRYLMVDDLEKEYNFVGMSKEEVFDILGEYDYCNDTSMRYLIRYIWLKDEYFYLFYDENGIITNTEIKIAK